MPIDWKDLKPSLNPARFTVQTVTADLKRRRLDPWRDYWRMKQRLSAVALKALRSL